MNRQQALNQLRLMQAWHEDNGNGPNADYDAICYAIGVIEAQPNGMDTLIKTLEEEHKKLVEMQKAQAKQRWIPCGERLPKVKQRVIVQYADGSMEIKRCIDAGHLQWFYARAVAWMPAPEPYAERRC